MRRYSKQDILDYLKAQIKRCKQKELAAEINYLESNLSEVLSGKRKISDGLAVKLGFNKLPAAYTRIRKPTQE